MNHQIVIIGAGTAGITVAAQLLLKNKKLDIAIIDPAQKHYYQAAWTLVGAGTYNYKSTVSNHSFLEIHHFLYNDTVLKHT